MHLWHMQSKVLKGFYASEVYVMAGNLPEAVDKAVRCFHAWMTNEENDYGYNPLTEDYPGESDYIHQFAVVLTSFEEEARHNLKQIPNNAVIFRRT